uniref:Mitochondrial import inner membrane translocase subunit TIM22 n=1 Tax=Coccolithus braarudii TaxID=221442 RepID=A0A7S0L0E6_9EUKA
MASRAALSIGLHADAVRLVFGGAVAGAMQFGGFLAVYNGGICTTERLRGKRDMANPFVVGGVMGVSGALPSFVQPTSSAPWAYRNPRALAAAGLSSAMMCSFFWSLGSSSRPLPEPAPEVTSPSSTLPVPSTQPQRLVFTPPQPETHRLEYEYETATTEPPLQPPAELAPAYDPSSSLAPTSPLAPISPLAPTSTLAPAVAPLADGYAPVGEQLNDPWAK